MCICTPLFYTLFVLRSNVFAYKGCNRCKVSQLKSFGLDSATHVSNIIAYESTFF